MLSKYEYNIIGDVVNGKDKRALVVEGIDFGYANPRWKGLPIIRETEHHFLCRIRGSMHRHGLASFGYVNPEYIIFTKDVVDGKPVVRNPLGDWTVEYSKEDMGVKKDLAIKELYKREENGS